MRQNQAKHNGNIGMAAFIIDVCSTSVISNFGRVSSGGIVGAILCFLLFMLVRRLSVTSFFLQHNNLLHKFEQHPLQNVILKKYLNINKKKAYCFFGSLKILSRRFSDHATFSRFTFRRHGIQQQHIRTSSLSSSVVLSILFVLRQQINLSIHKRHLPRLWTVSSVATALATVVAAAVAPSITENLSTDSTSPSCVFFLPPQQRIFFQQDDFVGGLLVVVSCWFFNFSDIGLVFDWFFRQQFEHFKRLHGIHILLQHGVQHFDNLQQPQPVGWSSASPFSDLRVEARKIELNN